MTSKDSLGDRMKRYEGNVKPSLCRRLPVIVRADGRAFHTVTRGRRAFDRAVIDRMVGAATDTLSEMQGGKLAYIQSDEASFLLTDWATVETEPWFGYDLQKVVSLTAAEMSVHWNRNPRVTNHCATFDARAFNLPHAEVANYFLWRAKDWACNSVQMLAQVHFSPAQMHGKGIPALLEMLRESGVPWENLRPQERLGTWIVSGGVRMDIPATYAAVSAFVDPLISQDLVPDARAALAAATEFEDIDSFARANGFADASELHRMIVAVDLGSVGRLRAFKAWQKDDGSKAGLLRLSEADHAEPPIASGWNPESDAE